MAGNTCFSCGEDLTILSQREAKCTKAGCPHLLEEVHVCDTCEQRSYVVSLSRCKNPTCDAFTG